MGYGGESWDCLFISTDYSLSADEVKDHDSIVIKIRQVDTAYFTIIDDNMKKSLLLNNQLFWTDAILINENPYIRELTRTKFSSKVSLGESGICTWIGNKDYSLNFKVVRIKKPNNLRRSSLWELLQDIDYCSLVRDTLFFLSVCLINTDSFDDSLIIISHYTGTSMSC